MALVSTSRRLSHDASACRIWALTPREIAAAGYDGSARELFAALQRPWRYRDGQPDVAPRARRWLDAQGARLPERLDVRRSEDGSTKLLIGVEGGAVEAVHMPRAIGAGRVTVCLSSQLGCALGCTFCATASMGLGRNLRAGEVVGQLLLVLAALGPSHAGQLTLVFMGMGEPLHNLGEVARALRVLCDPEGLGVSPRRVTVSTAGLVPQIDELGRLEPRPLLAVSLNATTDEVRRELMPIGRRYPLAELRAALERFPRRPRERITVEYVLLRGVNDSDEDARRLADYCASFPHNINLIPFNAHPHAAFAPPDERRLEGFAAALLARRPTLLTVRRSRGRDIQAACGQLVQARVAL